MGPFIKDVCTEGGGGGPKGDTVREVAWIQYCRSAPNADIGRRVQNTEKFADLLYGWLVKCYTFQSLYPAIKSSSHNLLVQRIVWLQYLGGYGVRLMQWGKEEDTSDPQWCCHLVMPLQRNSVLITFLSRLRDLAFYYLTRVASHPESFCQCMGIAVANRRLCEASTILSAVTHAYIHLNQWGSTVDCML